MSLSAVDLAAWDAALAALDPPPRDVFAEIGYVPTEKQAVFHSATEHDLLFGGSLGGGKSRAIMAEAIRAAVLHPGIRIGAFRRTYGELKESLVPELAAMEFGAAVGGKWNGTEYELRFANGSTIFLRYAETVVDATRRQGGQYQLLLFDERTLTPPDVCTYLETRLRSGRADLPVLGVKSTANPGGPGHGAVKARYIDATNYGADVYTDAAGQTVRFIPSSMVDNPHLDKGYAQRLTALDGTMRKAFLEGNWDVFSGQAFGIWSRDRHVIEPITLPPGWARYIGVDWGFRAPWAVIWCAIDEDGRMWAYRELYATQVGEAEQARQILAAEAADPNEHVGLRFADDAMWATRGDAKSIADVYADNGVHLTRAGKMSGSRIVGGQRVRSYLADGPACFMHRQQGQETCAMFHAFSTLANLARTIPTLTYATTGNPEDVDTAGEDHLYDAWRYLATNVGTGASFLLDD